MGKSIKGTITEQNLLTAFAGECQRKNRYEFFAEKARAEGYEQIAAIFDKTALQEQSHAKQFIKFMEGGAVEIKTVISTGLADQTIENLKVAITEEKNGWSAVYPHFSEIAKEEGFPAIAAIFKMIAKVEAEHEKRFMKLLKGLKMALSFIAKSPSGGNAANADMFMKGKNHPKFVRLVSTPQDILKRWQRIINSIFQLPLWPK